MTTVRMNKLYLIVVLVKNSCLLRCLDDYINQQPIIIFAANDRSDCDRQSLFASISF